jgi:large subunit ribosomal protein L10
MGKTRARKVEELERLRERLARMKVAVMTTSSKLTVSEETALRRSMRLAEADYLIIKKTLLRLGLKEAGIDPAGLESFDKPFSMTLGYGDEAGVAKALAAFQKEHEAVQFLGGILDGRFLNAAEVKALAKLPTKTEMLGQLVRTIQAPVSNFASVLRNNLSGLLTVLSAVRDQKSPTS